MAAKKDTLDSDSIFPYNTIHYYANLYRPAQKDQSQQHVRKGDSCRVEGKMHGRLADLCKGEQDDNGESGSESADEA